MIRIPNQRIHNQQEGKGEEGVIEYSPTPLLRSSYAPGRDRQRIVSINERAPCAGVEKQSGLVKPQESIVRPKYRKMGIEGGCEVTC